MRKVMFALKLAVALMLLATFLFSVKTANATANYDIEHVSHTVNVLYNGYVVVNDTVKLANITGAAPSTFLIGFPNSYGSQLVKCFAYSPTGALPVTLDASLEGRVGFYSVQVDFRQEMPQTFTVVFVFSNSLVEQDETNTSRFTLDFPSYPSLTKKVALCNASVVLPEGAAPINGTTNVFAYGTENLPEFTYSPASLAFTSSQGELQLFDVSLLKREMSVNEFGEVDCGDTYKITSKAKSTISSVKVFAPSNASNITAVDQFGRKMGVPTQINATTNCYLVNLTIEVLGNQSTNFVLKYRLPSDALHRQDGDSYMLSLALLQYEDYYITQTVVRITFPEGAKITSLGSAITSGDYSVSRSVFQESVTITRQGLMPTDNAIIEVTYHYNILWLSFRPTTWALTLAVIACAVIAVAWRKPETRAQIAGPVGAVRLRPEYLRSFVDAYEEKRKIDAELASLEDRVQKGKIPRRRYKVRRKMLEARLTTLQRNLEDFKARIRAAGGQYLDYMRQLEVAETEITEVAANLKSIEARHGRGELSLEGYRKMLSDYERRRESAETTIDGILLRLREESR
ncbi:MAG: hypothetical protein QXJ02_03835 [Candidatus Bathyarchaeia archaeon]